MWRFDYLNIKKLIKRFNQNVSTGAAGKLKQLVYLLRQLPETAPAKAVEKARLRALVL